LHFDKPEQEILFVQTGKKTAPPASWQANMDIILLSVVHRNSKNQPGQINWYLMSDMSVILA